jgi:hypothetical protein
MAVPSINKTEFSNVANQVWPRAGRCNRAQSLPIVGKPGGAIFTRAARIKAGHAGHDYAPIVLKGRNLSRNTGFAQPKFINQLISRPDLNLWASRKSLWEAELAHKPGCPGEL